MHSLQMLLSTIGGFQPTREANKWKCNLSSDGVYHMNTLRAKIDQLEPANSEVIIPWIHDVPIKVITFIWRANLWRILTNVALRRRGIQIPNILCPQCLQQDEDIGHLMIRCPLALIVWELIFKWCDIPDPQFDNINDLISFAKNWGRCPKRRNNLISVCYGTMWLLWKSRCDWVFKNIHSNPMLVVDKVKTSVYSWLINRRNKCHYRWIDWTICPLQCL